ncbi:MAG: RcpC/CpaB family pilus assembly protein [Mycoplasmatota bacterium]|nr:RcpC/CpaB family pilus assembly protein [Mycoplasmatota bacterium]
MTGLKKFLQNKNTVTVIGIIAAIVILYVAYNMRVQSAINPVNVPYAKVQINPGTQITADMVGTRAVPPSMLEGEVLTAQNQVIDKYSSADTVIPAGSLFYTRTVVEKEQLPANIILTYPKGYVLYNMSVTTATTYGNSIYPGNYIDIYLKAVNRLAEGEAATADSDKIMLGKLLSNVKVLAVKDSSGQPVFSNLDEQRTPAMIVFAVPEEYYVLLKKAEYLRTYESTLIPVPTNESMKDEPGDLEISSEQLKDWINRVTVWTEQ